MWQGPSTNGKAPSGILPLAPTFHKSHVVGGLALKIVPIIAKVWCDKIGGKTLNNQPRVGNYCNVMRLIADHNCASQKIGGKASTDFPWSCNVMDHGSLSHLIEKYNYFIYGSLILYQIMICERFPKAICLSVGVSTSVRPATSQSHITDHVHKL